jgi:hypothetical protein
MKANIDPSGRSQLLSIPTGAVVSTPRASAILTGRGGLGEVMKTLSQNHF